MSAKHRNPDDATPAPPCLAPEDLESVKRAVAPAPLDVERVQVVARPIAIAGGVISIGGFIIYCTLAVSTFMHETRAFQGSVTSSMEATGEAMKAITKQLATVTERQNGVIADRWRFSDMQPWAYQLERANRDVLREGGNKGLVVPEPVAKPAPQN